MKMHNPTSIQEILSFFDREVLKQDLDSPQKRELPKVEDPAEPTSDEMTPTSDAAN